MNTSYYNTTGESGPQLSLFNQKAKTQDKNILKFFQAHKDRQISASDILVNNVLENGLITSIRRSINTLAKEMYIIKVGSKTSIYDRKEFTYQLNREIIEK